MLSEADKIHQNIQNFYKGITLQGYKPYQLNPIFKKFMDRNNWHLQHLTNLSSNHTIKEYTTKKKNNIVFELQPQVNNNQSPPTCLDYPLEITEYNNTIANLTKSHGKSIDTNWLIVAYSRPTPCDKICHAFLWNTLRFHPRRINKPPDTLPPVHWKSYWTLDTQPYNRGLHIPVHLPGIHKWMKWTEMRV